MSCQLKNQQNLETSNLLKICFTGHRPKNLPWGFDENKNSCLKFKQQMYDIIEKAIINGYNYFITGMALGIDIICAEIVLRLKQKYKNVFLECAIPCLNQTKKWSIKQQNRYENIVKQADFIFYVSKEEYKAGCMEKRNNYMVNKSDVVIAVWNGTASGTYNTIKLCKKNGKKLKVIKLNCFY